MISRARCYEMSNVALKADGFPAERESAFTYLKQYLVFLLASSNPAEYTMRLHISRMTFTSCSDALLKGKNEVGQYQLLPRCA